MKFHDYYTELLLLLCIYNYFIILFSLSINKLSWSDSTGNGSLNFRQKAILIMYVMQTSIVL